MRCSTKVSPAVSNARQSVLGQSSLVDVSILAYDVELVMNTRTATSKEK